MVCYQEKTVATCTKVVLIVSALMFLVGLLTCVFGAMSMGAIPGPIADALEELAVGNLGLGIILIGIVCIVIGVLGCCFGKSKNKLAGTIFIVLSGLVGLICLILGFIMSGHGAKLIDKGIDKLCTTVTSDFQNQFTSAVDNTMCTNKCKCNPGPNNMNKGIWTDNTLVWADNAGEGVNNYQDCLKAQTKDQQSDSTKKFFEDGGMKMLLELESAYDCAGYCKTGKFYLAKNLNYGPPENDCVRAGIKGIGQKAGSAAYVTIFLGLVLMVAVIGAFPVCQGFK